MISGVRASSIRIEIDLVDDRVLERPVDHLLQPEFHVVAQIVEAQLVIRAIGDVAAIGFLPLVIVQLVDDDADTQAEKPVDLPHPFGVALRQIVVDRDDMHALARERIEIDRQRRDQRLALAGLHLGDHAAMQHDPAHQLHIEMALAERALGGLAHRRERLDEQIVEFGAIGEPRLEFGRAGAQRLVRQLLKLGLQLVDLIDQRLEAFDVAVVGGAEQPPG